MAAEKLPPPRRFTPEEYLRIERAAKYKSEYLDGQIYAMSGGSPKHGEITAHVIRIVGNQIFDSPCHLYTSDVKIRSAPTGIFAYPDMSLVCGEPEFHDSRQDVITNPVVIVEVLSPSTERYDRETKFEQYRQIATLRDYLLVSQSAPSIDHYARQDDDTWLLRPARGLDAEVRLSGVECILRLADVYRKIVFTPEDTEILPSE